MARENKNSAIKTLREAKNAAHGTTGNLIVVDENGCIFVDCPAEYLHKKKEKIFVAKGTLPPKQIKKESDATE